MRQPPAATDIAIIEPPPQGSSDVNELGWYLARATRTIMLNATVERQERAALLALFGKTIVETAIAANAAVIASPPTQANVQSLQATINLLVSQVNALSTTLGALVDAINANLKSLPNSGLQEN